MATDLSIYRDNLRHVVRPEERRERAEAPQIHLSDYTALYFKRVLEEFASYGDGTEKQNNIAMAYVQYIDYIVRDEEQHNVVLYAHTENARDVLREVVEWDVGRDTHVHESVEDAVEEL